jgi:hypothetical protein
VYRRLPILLVMAFGAYTVLRPSDDWQLFYLPAARLFVNAGNFYGSRQFTYPPGAILLPWAALALPAWLQTGAWIAVNLAAMLLLLAIAWRGSGGRWPPREHGAFFAGLAVSIRFLLPAFEHRQTDIVVAALATTSVYAAMRGRTTVGGALAGAAAALKATPLALAGAFTVTRRWRAVAVMASVAAILTVMPDLMHRAPGGRLWIQEWRQMLAQFAAGTAMFDWPADAWYNQSIAGTVQRVGSHTSPAVLVRLTVVGIGAVAAVAAAALLGRARGEGAAVPRGAVQFAAVLAAMPLVSPVSGVYHFMILSQPAWTVARLAAVEGRRDARMLFGASVLLALLSWRRFGLGSALVFYGGIPLAAALLLVACALANLSGTSAISAGSFLPARRVYSQGEEAARP